MARLLAYKLGEPKSYDTVVDPEVGGQERYSLLGLTPPVRFAHGISLSDAMVAGSARHVSNISAKDKGRILLFMLDAGLACIEFTDTGSAVDVKDTGYVLRELEACSEERQLRNLFDKVSICLTTPLFYTRLGDEILKLAGVDASNLCRGDMLGKMLEVYVRGATVMRSVNRTMHSVKLRHCGLGEVDVFDSANELLIECTVSNKKAGEVSVQKYFKDASLTRVCTMRDKRFFDGVYHRIPYPAMCCMLDADTTHALPRTFGATDEQMAEMAANYGKAKRPADEVSDIVLALVNNAGGKRVGLRIWRHETQQAEMVAVPAELRAWNLDIVHNRLTPKLCNLGDFPVLTAVSGHALLSDVAKYTVSRSGGWVIGEYMDGRLRLMSAIGSVKDVTQETAQAYYEKHALSNADFDSSKSKLVGKLNRWFDRIG